MTGSSANLNYENKIKPMIKSIHLPQTHNLKQKIKMEFGAGARTDIIMFFLQHPGEAIFLSDLDDLGYSARTIVDILERFITANICKKVSVLNKIKYRLVDEQLIRDKLGCGMDTKTE